jgi:hypothetical protein
MVISGVGSWENAIGSKTGNSDPLLPLNQDGSVVKLGDSESETRASLVQGDLPSALGSSGETILTLKDDGFDSSDSDWVRPLRAPDCSISGG